LCGRLFSPDRRAAEMQYACGDGACQRERHRRNCAAWNDAHREQFRGRNGDTKAWLAEHPGYLAAHRRAHPEAAERHREEERKRRKRRREAAVAIQDERLVLSLAGKEVKSSYDGVAIQDAIRSHLFVSIGLATVKDRVDIQDPMALRLPALYSLGREVFRWAVNDRHPAAG
jgi:hypothetical protein